MTKTAKTAHEPTFVPPVAPKIEIPAVARELVQRAAKSAEARVETLNAGVEKATSTLESAFGGAASTFAEASRALQGAVYADVKATRSPWLRSCRLRRPSPTPRSCRSSSSMPAARSASSG